MFLYHPIEIRKSFTYLDSHLSALLDTLTHSLDTAGRGYCCIDVPSHETHVTEVSATGISIRETGSEVRDAKLPG